MKRNIEIRYVQDDYADDPRKAYDHLFTFLFSHKCYQLGDKTSYNVGAFSSWLELAEYIERKENVVLMRAVRAYDHSGISISLSNSYPYNDQWDSGQIGLAYVTKEGVKEFMGWKVITKKRLAQLEHNLKCEIEEYDSYLRGDVWGYEIIDTDSEEILASCFGFYGQEYCRQEAETDAEYYRNTVDIDKITNYRELIDAVTGA